MVYLVDYHLALILIVWIFFALLFSYTVFPYFSHYSFTAANARSTGAGKLVDTITNIPTISLFGTHLNEKKYLADSFQDIFTAERERDSFFLKMDAIQAYSFIVVECLGAYFLVQGLYNNRVTIGDFILVLTINSSIRDRLWYMIDDIRKFCQELARVKQGLAEIMAPIAINNIPNALPLMVTKGEIIIDSVQFSYTRDQTLFNNFSVHIYSKQKIGIVGYSGSGKSTFVKLMLRLCDIQKGSITIDNQNIAHVTQESLRHSIGIIPQEPSLFQRSIMENIKYGASNASDESVIDAAKKAQLHDFIMTLKDTYHTIVGAQGTTLSGGQRQRVAIGRVLLKNPSIIFFDEATSQLDSITEGLIQKSLSTLMCDRTSLVIAHRLSTLVNMDRILVFDAGRVIEDGTHNQLLALNGQYKKLCDAQTNGLLPTDITT